MIMAHRLTRPGYYMLFTALLLCLTTIMPHTTLQSQAESFNITKRARVLFGGQYQITRNTENWNPAETAVIVCDMWNLHHCKNAVTRVTEIAPRMDAFIAKARSTGALVIHAPSSCMDFYKNHPGRKIAQSAPKASNLPKDIATWCHSIPSEEQGVYPIDQSDGGEDDDPDEHKAWAEKLKNMGRNPRAPWKRQTDLLTIKDGDAISDSGVEIWNLLEARGIKNVMLVGVHTNMCVLGRPFGLRRMAQNGKNVVLVRDMTDTMYNPKMWPYVSHYRGTDLIIEHIEKFVCPTITSDQLLGGQRFYFDWDKRPKVVFMIAEKEYETINTLPLFADRLETEFGLRNVILTASEKDKEVIPGVQEHLKDADLLFVSVRRRALPEADVATIKAYVKSGKPLIGIRTASHAFHTKGKSKSGHAEWQEFDNKVLGGNYHNHYGNKLITTVTKANDDTIINPLLLNVKTPFKSKASLYRTSPLAKGTTLLLLGQVKDHDPEPLAWTNQYGKSRIFYTSLGHVDDFKNPAFNNLLRNAVQWTMKLANPKPIPPKP